MHRCRRTRPARSTTAHGRAPCPRCCCTTTSTAACARPRCSSCCARAAWTAPAADAAALAAWFDARAHAGSLAEYLQGFALTVAAMATPPALERVAFEAAEDARADGCVLAEFRIAPLLFEAHGLAAEAAIEAMLAGLTRSALPSGLILCAMRERSKTEAERVAALAARYHRPRRDRLRPGRRRARPSAGRACRMRCASRRDAGVPLTVHAGEADAAPRVIEAARLGARRIGHGVRLADALNTRDGAALIDEARARRAAPGAVPDQQRAHRRRGIDRPRTRSARCTGPA